MTFFYRADEGLGGQFIKGRMPKDGAKALYGAKLEGLLQMLVDMKPGEEMNTRELSERLGVNWRKKGTSLLNNPRIKAAMETTGVEYQSVRGRNGSSRFVKTDTKALPKAA